MCTGPSSFERLRQTLRPLEGLAHVVKRQRPPGGLPAASLGKSGTAREEPVGSQGKPVVVLAFGRQRQQRGPQLAAGNLPDANEPIVTAADDEGAGLVHRD